ncbi:MAG: hypothetical protein ACR2N2_10680 [Acidimicrobiia bacterium]
MATDKRDRQRANREEKKAAEAKKAKRRRWFDLGKKYALYALLFVAAIIVFRIVAG